MAGAKDDVRHGVPGPKGPGTPTPGPGSSSGRREPARRHASRSRQIPAHERSIHSQDTLSPSEREGAERCRGREPVVRSALLILVLGTIPAAAATPKGPTSQPSRTVPCAESISTTEFPYVGYRQVLGAISVPPAYLQQIVRTRSRPWRYWRKAGLVVRAGVTVTVEVPAEWRARAAIAWGNGGNAVFSSLRLAACRGQPGTGFAYPGGFYLRASTACLPLIFHAGQRRATVRFGLGRRCDKS
jgi:hypothetical protein